MDEHVAWSSCSFLRLESLERRRGSADAGFKPLISIRLHDRTAQILDRQTDRHVYLFGVFYNK